MEQRFAAAFGLFALGIALGGFFKEMDFVGMRTLGRAIQLGAGLASGLWAILLALTPVQYNFASFPMGVSLLMAVVIASLFAGVILILDKFGGVLKSPD
jgi:hypothetical protein